jgi:hypothetical protein
MCTVFTNMHTYLCKYIYFNLYLHVHVRVHIQHIYIYSNTYYNIIDNAAIVLIIAPVKAYKYTEISILICMHT